MRLTSLSLKTIEHDRNILKAYLFGRWSEGLSEIKNIKAFHQEEFVENSFQIQNQKLFHLSLSGYFKTACLSSMVIFFVIVGGGVLFVLGLQEIQKNHLSTQDFLAFLFYLILVAATSGTLRNLILEWSQFLSSWHAITPHLEKKEPKKYSKKLFSPRGIIAFHKVHFSYNKEPLLKDITLSVTPGECLAIVGASGVGKTTLFSLILKFYQPQEGSIYMDGADISGICDEDVRKRIGWVSHNTPIFSGSVYENIMWGSEQSFSSQDIYGAAEQANALKFIENLPSGFQTQVGLGGVSLSFEERQRIAMARIILRNPYIFLFDEETNVLDPENEQAIQKSLHTLFSSRTSLVIAHRPSTILQAHRIAVLDGGRICGLGTHKELMQSHPLYPRLVNLEFGMAT